MVKNDKWIREMSEKGMISDYTDKQVKRNVISYGVSSYGYDMRLAGVFKIFTSAWNSLVDPKRFSKKSFVDIAPEDLRQDDDGGRYIIVPPNGFILGSSLECFNIPRDVIAICLGKSTYARCGIVVNVTPLEPEWEGHVTIEISNTSTLPAKVYAYEGIAQVIFLGTEEICETSYKDKAGKYQGQTGVTLPKV